MERAPFKAPLMTNRASAASSEGDGIWWGYMSESDLSVSDGVGNGSSNIPLLAGIYIPANHELIGGSTIKAVRVYVKDGLGSTMKNVSVWISQSLPASVDAADYVQSVNSLADGANDIELTTPFVVNNREFYIGYAVTSSNAYPIMCCGSEDAPNAFYICAPGSIDWTDLYGSGLGKLAFQIRADGVSLASNSATPSDFGPAYVLKGETTSVPVRITNNGANNITSISYTITTGSSTTEEATVRVDNLPFNSSANVYIPFASDNKAKKYIKTLTITKVNGEANEAAHNSAQGALITILETAVPVPVVEEFTGTWCGYCVYGITGMEKTYENFGDKVVLIAAHNGDPMAISDYDPIMSRVHSFPSSFINRTIDAYPTASTLKYYLNTCFDAITVGDIQASAAWTSDDKTEISIDTKTKFVYSDDNGQYGIAYVLVEDGLTGSGSEWAQSNYLSGGSGDADMEFWYNSGSKVSGLEYNHVAVGAWGIENGISGSVNSKINAGEVQNYNFKADITSKSVIQDKSKLKVVALLIDQTTGKIINAAQVAIKDKAVEAKVKLSKTKAVIEKGKTLTLKSKVYPTTEDQTVTWKSSDKTVATVTSAGKVKGVGAGTATITCTSKATGAKATCKVTVGYVKLSKTEVVIEKGEIVTLKSKVYPSTVKDQSVTWESSDPTIVKVGSTGKIKGMKVGKATVTCTSNATGLKATCEVTVGYVKLSDTKVTLEKGKTLTLKSKVYPTTEDQSVTWESSDPTIVKVASTGKIKGMKVGKATITCTSNATGLSATCKVTVVKASSAPSLDDVTGIEEKSALAEEFDVYDLNGRRVLDKATSLDGLSNGVYIVNGKKVVKK